MRVAKNNKNYLTITQTEEQGKQWVIVFADNIQKFADALNSALTSSINKNFLLPSFNATATNGSKDGEPAPLIQLQSTEMVTGPGGPAMDPGLVEGVK